MPVLLIDQLSRTSAILNGIAIPGRSVESALSRHTFNVFVSNEDDLFSVLLRGSGTAVRFGGKELLLCTQHQLAGIDRQKVGMMTEGGRMLLTSGGMRHFSMRHDTDANDIVAFDFSEPVAAYPELASRFFNLSARRPVDQEIVGVLLVGCPTIDQNYDVYDNNHIGLARRSVVCTPDPTLPADLATVRVIPKETLSVNPDGMSGGSAFIVHHGSLGFEIDFGGIIVRGGSERMTLIKPGIVLDFLNAITASW